MIKRRAKGSVQARKPSLGGVRKPAVPRVQSGSALEAEMAWQIRVTGLPNPAREHRFHPTRQWRLDFAWPSLMVALEVEGLVPEEKGKGRHQTVHGFERDAEKYTEAALAGWTLLRVTRKHIKSGQALQWLERAINQKQSEGTDEADTGG